MPLTVYDKSVLLSARKDSMYLISVLKNDNNISDFLLRHCNSVRKVLLVEADWCAYTHTHKYISDCSPSRRYLNKCWYYVNLIIWDKFQKHLIIPQLSCKKLIHRLQKWWIFLSRSLCDEDETFYALSVCSPQYTVANLCGWLYSKSEARA